MNASAAGYFDHFEEHLAPDGEVTITLVTGAALSVSVADGAGPVANATVHVVGESADSEASGKSFITDEKGRCEVSGLADSSYAVWAEKEARVSDRVEIVSIEEEGDPRRAIAFQLGRSATLRGRVVDAESAAPLRGARVLFCADSTGHSACGYARRTVTHADGLFEFAGLPPGEYRGGADLDGCRMAGDIEADLTDTAGVTIEIPIPPATTIQGVVIDTAGDPVNNASLQATDNCQTKRMTTTGRDGSFRFEEIAPGVSLDVTHPDYVRRRLIIASPVHQPITDTAIVLEGGGAIEGVATGADGEPLAGINVVAGATELRAYAERWTAKTVTGADGRFTFRPVPAGKTLIDANDTSDARTAQHQAVIVHPGERVVGLEFRFAPEANVSGTVVDQEGAPIGLATIVCHDHPSAPRAPLRARTDDDGKFVVRGVAGGCGELDVKASERRAQTIREVAGGTENLRIVLAPAAVLTGSVVDASDGSAVTTLSLPGGLRVGGCPGFEMRELDDVPRRWLLSSPGYGAARIGPFVAVGADTVDAGVIRLGRGATLRGRVVDVAHRGVADVAVTLRAVSDDDLPLVADGDPLSARTQGDGGFVIEHVGAGRWSLEARARQQDFGLLGRARLTRDVWIQSDDPVDLGAMTLAPSDLSTAEPY